MKKRLLSLFMALSLLLGMLPASALAAELPDTAPFNSVIADAEGEIRVTEAAALSIRLGEAAFAETLHQHILVPEGTETAYVTYSEDAVYTANGKAYGIACSLPGGSGKAATLKAEAGDDGSVTIELPVAEYLAFENEDGSWEGDAFAPQDSNLQPVNVLSFGYNLEAAAFGGEETVTIPEGAPFTAITSDKGAVKGIEDKGTVDYNGYSTYYGVPLYHVTLPAGATAVDVTYPASEDPFVGYNEYSGAYEANGYYAETTGWTGGAITLSYTETEDGYTICFPLEMVVEDWFTGAVELNFAEGYAAAVERTENSENGSFTPIAFFTFEVEAGEACEHDWSDWTQTTAPTCTEAGSKTRTCTRDESHTETNTTDEDVKALGHAWGDWEITKTPNCTEAGSKTRTCTRDESHTETNTTDEDVKATGHSFNGTDCDNPGCDEPDPDAGAPAQEGGVYQIGDAEGLLWFADAVSRGNTTIKGALTTDIDLSSVTWTPIGTESNKFSGSFDGNGNSVTFNNASNGLFAYVQGASHSACAEIKNIVIEGSINGGENSYVAGLVARGADVNISGCINKASVSGGNYTAGILGNRYVNIGQSHGVSITDCGNEGAVTGGTNVGGLVGYAQGNTAITRSYNRGKISGSSTVGGLVGYLQGYPGLSDVANSYNQGSISGGSLAGGLIGNLYNGVSVSNCFNAGTAPYGIAGNVYNKTASITNSYYLSSASAEGVPASDLFDSIRIAAKTRDELGADSFAETLGSSFQAACPFPALSWEDSKTHSLTDGVCSVCNYGSTEAQSFTVTLPSGAGYTVNGEATATEGESYSFTVVITDGYMKGESFTVKVNGETVTEADGSYTWAKVEGPLNITVSGVEKIPDTYTVTLPAEGYGYRVNPSNGSVSGSSVTVNRGADFRFTLSFVEGFRAGEDFAVTAAGRTLSAVGGVYTIANVTANQSITVSGVEQIPGTEPVNVTMTVTYGTKLLADASADESGDPLVLRELAVPYFDLALYGLERYYYNPNCYTGDIQQPGTPEQAYGVVTAMHVLIYATEVFRLDVDPDKAGTGMTAGKKLESQLSWDSAPAGSSFAQLWEYGSNQNYYIDYVYPLGRQGFGATSDQIALKDGSVLSIHAIESRNANGSNFAFFTADDTDDVFQFGTDTVDRTAVKQGDLVTLTLYRSVNDGSYTTKYTTVAGQQLYWTDEANLDLDVSQWETEGFAGLSKAEFVVDANGDLVLDTGSLEPGTYYIGALGGLTAGGYGDGTGFVSQGDETGPAVFCLTVEKGDGDETVLGDVTGDGKVNIKDAALVYAACNGKQELTDVQFASADIDGNGKINIVDAASVYSICNGKYKFPNS